MNFIIQFEKLLKINEWVSKDEYEKLYSLFLLEQNKNEIFLLEKLKEFSIEKGKEYIMNFYTITGFIKYLGETHKYRNPEIVEKLKHILTFVIGQEKPEKYSYVLDIIFSINKKDNHFYISQYEDVKQSNKLFHDINQAFLDIFIELEINDKFILAFQQNIVDNATEVYFFSVKKGFEYLVRLEKSIFKKYFLELLGFFSLKDNKEKLVDFHEYPSLIKTYDRKDFVDILGKLIQKIAESNFSKIDNQNIKNFILGDIDFAVENYDKDLLDNIFINELFKYYYDIDNNFLIEVLSGIEKKRGIFGIQTFILEYLTEDLVEDFIRLFIESDNVNIIYYTYDRFKQSEKNNVVQVFENGSLAKEIKERNKVINKNNKKLEREKKEKIQKDKDDFFKMLNPGKGKYFPKLFQDYVHYLKSEKGLEGIFTQQEIAKINSSLKKQIQVYLEALKISGYNDEKISKILTFEKTKENSYTHTWNSVYLGWIIDISKSLDFNLSKYHTSFVLFYPLLWGAERVKDVLEIISKNLNSQDIDYILRVYSEDLHENAKGLRYYHIDTLNDFYQVFKSKFTVAQKKKLEVICLDVINGDDENNIYYKENFLKIYSEIAGKTKLLKLWKDWEVKFSSFNYFKDYLDDDEIEKSKEDDIKFFTFIAKELVQTYKHRLTVLWAIKQVKNGLIEATERTRIEYPYSSATFSGVSKKESELGRWGRDQYNLGYIFEIIPDIDILDEILKLLDYSFSIQANLEDGSLVGDYEMYAFYIRGLFYKYAKNLNSKFIDNTYYYKLKKILNKYNYKITYNFNLSDIKEKFGVDDIEEEAKEIIDNEGLKGVVKLLEETEKNYLLGTKRISLDEEIYKYKETIKGLENKNKILLEENNLLKNTNEDKQKLISEIDKLKSEKKESNKIRGEIFRKFEKLKEKNIKLYDDNYGLLSISKITNLICIIIVEGPSDKKYLDTFFDIKKLKNRRLKVPLVIIGGGSRGVLSLLRHYENTFLNIPIVGLFDFDYSGVNEFYELNENKGYALVQNNHHKGLLKKHKSYELYGLLLPVPDNKIKKQVLKRELNIKSISGIPGDTTDDIKDFGVDSKMEIEHLFYDVLKGTFPKYNNKLKKTFYGKGISHGTGTYIKLNLDDKNKDVSCKDIKSKKKISDMICDLSFFDNNDKVLGYLFKNFEPIYDTIKDLLKTKGM